MYLKAVGVQNKEELKGRVYRTTKIYDLVHKHPRTESETTHGI